MTIKKYIVPISLMIMTLIGFMDDPFRYDLDYHVSWSGALGHQNYFHYWYLTNHKLLLLSMLSLMAYIVRLDRFSFWFIITYICYNVYELINYLYYGGTYFTDVQQQTRESYVTIGFFVTVIILLIKDKWRQQK
jgi:hypothetical protein